MTLYEMSVHQKHNLELAIGTLNLFISKKKNKRFFDSEDYNIKLINMEGVEIFIDTVEKAEEAKKHIELILALEKAYSKDI